MELNKGLADYRLFLESQGLHASNLEVKSAAVTVAAQLRNGDADPASAVTAAPDSPGEASISTAKSSKLKGFWDDLKGDARDQKKFLKWALFGKEKIEALLSRYQPWSEELRKVMQLMLLAEGRVGSQTRADLASGHTELSQVNGLRKIATRQIRAQDTEPPSELAAVNGEFVAGTALEPDAQDAPASYQVGTYIDELGESIAAISEQHVFDIFTEDTDAATKQKIRLQLIRSLAWILTVDSKSQDWTEGHGENSTDLLRCIGYVEDNGNSYPALLYCLPSAGVSQTLYDYFNTAPAPSLGDRFFIAWSLASTVFDIHTSGWVHKNIRSRGILLSAAKESSRPTPYLVGWTMARPQDKQMKIVSEARGELERKQERSQKPVVLLEPQFYMHADRYGGTTKGFESKHDIYSLGVVLLEIGL
ncbi:hypothetical protein Dda_5443 [Drechslerella dactyloides]|uniref:Protein kinase domain-containing protein n=1 Tax=Drechslerella dactyloides TaxID=74499 RepID=A0AAD6IWS6_DREDA|nr:hypothetical protein Dda_5443 [Drechslerella dactyloides]